MAIVDSVLPRIGVFYSDESKEAEVEGMINGAIAYFKGAGAFSKVPRPFLLTAPLNGFKI